MISVGNFFKYIVTDLFHYLGRESRIMELCGHSALFVPGLPSTIGHTMLIITFSRNLSIHMIKGKYTLFYTMLISAGIVYIAVDIIKSTFSVILLTGNEIAILIQFGKAVTPS
ncbi:hypothetical protein D3C86_1683220 [compost metagenome]